MSETSSEHGESTTKTQRGKEGTAANTVSVAILLLTNSEVFIEPYAAMNSDICEFGS